MNKLHAIDVFVAIAKYGSMTEAANRLNKSLPAVVRTLALLEETLGVRLFNRTTRRIALTEEGRIYLAYCLQMKSEMSAIENQLIGDREEPEGLVHITAPHMFGEELVVPAVTQILEEHSLLNIRLLLLDRIVDLVHERIDIAIRIGHLEDSNLIARPIGLMRQVVCASPAFLEAYDRPSHPMDIANKPCIQSDGIGSGISWRFEKEGKSVYVPISGKMICNITRPNVQGCVAGLGYGSFYLYQVSEPIGKGELEIILSDFEPEPLPVSLIYPHARLLSSRVQCVLNALDSNLKQAFERLPT